MVNPLGMEGASFANLRREPAGMMEIAIEHVKAVGCAMYPVVEKMMVDVPSLWLSGSIPSIQIQQLTLTRQSSTQTLA